MNCYASFHAMCVALVILPKDWSDEFLNPNKSLEAWEELGCVKCKLGLSSKACEQNKRGVFQAFHGGDCFAFLAH